MKWQNILKGKIRLNEPLCLHTTFRIGGKVEVWIEPNDLEDLHLFFKIIKDKVKEPFFVIGAGSNILVRDRFIKAVAVALHSPYFRQLKCAGTDVLAGAGTKLSELINFAKKLDLGGIEFLSGIPGTVGGALIMNAGTKSKNIGALIKEVTVMNKQGRLNNVEGKDLKFGYRSSDLSKYIILEARLRLKKMNKDLVEDKIKSFIAYRKKTQGLYYPSAGCIFKNHDNKSAGKLIELCGLKGKRIGGAQISEKHANFIINKGRAKANDVLRLMQLIQNKVKEEFGIWLEPEIKIL
jgi:UDP-N-acetylmuramate dehydrogenase